MYTANLMISLIWTSDFFLNCFCLILSLQTSKGGAYSQKNNQNKQGNKNKKSGQKKRKKKRNLFMGKLLKKSV